jgi:Na+-driven multidrug efflux pump
MTTTPPTGRISEFSRLFFPVLLITFSTSIYLLVEKLILGRVSVVAMEAAVTVAYVCQIFQISSIALAMMAQVFIAKQHGAHDLKSMGPGIWQFIWFSLLSTLITVPVGMVYGNYYLNGMSVKEIALPYLTFLLFINFLYPLGAALSCFYIGQGKTLLVLFSTIASQLVKIALAYALIPSWGSQSPTLGLLGAAISTFVAQASFCLALFWVFTHRKHAEKYQSRTWRFQPKLFWENIHPGLLRAINRILNVTCWTSIAHLMALKGEMYLLNLSIGGAIFLFLPFLSDATCQTQTVIVSRILGAKQYFQLWGAFRLGTLWSLAFIALVSIPLLVFPLPIYQYLFPNIHLEPAMVRQVFLGLWTSFVFYALVFVPIGYILAFKDMYFSLFMGAFNWVNGYLLMYIAIEKVGISAEYFWLVLSLMHGTTLILYTLRARMLCSRVLTPTRVKA